LKDDVLGPFSHTFEAPDGPHTVYHAMPIMLGVLAVLAIAYRYYSAFLAAKVAVLDDSRVTPAHLLNDGQNYHPTNKWVLFGHHFAAISGAGPLIGPVLAIQYGYMPGLLWLLIGVCFAGAVQDMLVMAVSVRTQGKSLAEIARGELGNKAAIVVSAAILFIVVIALSGLGFVVVKALGGEEINVAGSSIFPPPGLKPEIEEHRSDASHVVYRFPDGCAIRDRPDDPLVHHQAEGFSIRVPIDKPLKPGAGPMTLLARGLSITPTAVDNVLLATTPVDEYPLPPGSVELVTGSSWGTFTIACTVPIALFVGLYMYRLRKGRVFEASLLGAAAVLAAVVVGKWIPGSALEPFFALTRRQSLIALTSYGFIASVLPVWLLLCPRDYLSSFLKIGTIALLVFGVLLANPPLLAPRLNEVFATGGPTFPGAIFPFVFICIMCGAISGFHALVSSGTTPKMIDKESHIRTIGYGSMLLEGLVGVVALIAAASLDPQLYYDMNVDRQKAKEFRSQLSDLYRRYPTPTEGSGLHDIRVERKRDLASVNKMVGGGESLRGRTGGAVTLAVGMALIFDDALAWTGLDSANIIQYWFHFAIMFEALFILTTIDTGTRIARFLVQETLGRVFPKFGRTDWLPGAALATALVTFGWGALVWDSSIDTIWPMFGIANQLLSVVALALVTTHLVNAGRARYAPLTIIPMLFVTMTTLTAGSQLIARWYGLIQQGADPFKFGLNIGFALFIILSVLALLLMAAARWAGVALGMVNPRKPD
jgi:carbon starvation protein